MGDTNKPIITPFENGMELITIANSTLNTSTIGFTFGSRNDPEWFDGAAHELEHIGIAGAAPAAIAHALRVGKEPPVSGRELTRLMRRYLGGTDGPSMNVFTMHSHTSYGHGDLLYRRHLHYVFDRFGRAIRDAMYELRNMKHDKGILDRWQFRVEQAAVDNETGENDDTAAIESMKRASRLLYTTNPARRYGDSDPEQLPKVKLGRLKQWAQQHMVPPNLRVIMVGPTRNEGVEMVRKAFGPVPDWPAEPLVVDPNDIVPVLRDMRYEEVAKPGIRMTHVMLMWPTEPFTSKDMHVNVVLSELLKDRIEDELREGNQALPGGIYHPEAVWEGTSTHGLFRIWFATKGGPDHAAELTARLLQVIASIRDGSLGTLDEDVEDCVGFEMDAYHSMYRFSPGEIADMVLEYISNGDTTLRRFQNYKKDMARVTPKRVREAANRYLDPERRVQVVIKPV